ncbi:MAG: carboxypeptidase-like regulatory domain-containing protein [Ferruginibacter sp.]
MRFIKKRLKCLFLLFCPVITFCQTYYSGIIVKKSTHEKIPYATIGLVKENRGTTSNENGNFKIASRYENDSLRVSAVGFKTIVYPITHAFDSIMIELEENQIVLKEVIVSNRTMKESPVRVNDFDNCGINYFSVGLRTYSQIAQYNCAPRENMQLSKLRICKSANSSKFRVRIYEMDSITGKPSKDLALQSIDVNSSKRNVELDLMGYNIFLKKKDFYIAIEWLFIPSNEFTVKTKIRREKIIFSNYYPYLSYKRADANKENSGRRLWLLNFNGRWEPPFEAHENFNFMISAELIPF